MVKGTRKKYLGVRIYYIDELFALETRLLSIREFNPGSMVRQTVQLSNLLMIWIEAVLSDYNLNKKNIYGSTTDGGSDVKRWAKLISKVWEHCPPHKMTRAVVDAIGYKKKNTDLSKYYEVTALVDQVKASIVKIKETTKLSDLFDELNKMQGIKKTLQLFHPHRMMGVYTFL